MSLNSSILEYLGGIERTIRLFSYLASLGLILEYLGGIESHLNALIEESIKADFRIPRRD